MKSLLTRSAIGALALGVALYGATPAQAVSFDGGGDGSSWNDALNWTDDIVPGTLDGMMNPEDARIGDGDSAVFTATVALAEEPTIAQIGDLRVGTGVGGTGTFNHSSGAIAPRVDRWAFVGNDGTGLLPSIGRVQ